MSVPRRGEMFWSNESTRIENTVIIAYLHDLTPCSDIYFFLTDAGNRTHQVITTGTIVPSSNQNYRTGKRNFLFVGSANARSSTPSRRRLCLIFYTSHFLREWNRNQGRGRSDEAVSYARSSKMVFAITNTGAVLIFLSLGLPSRATGRV
jgi:hypothetical protein